MFYWPNSIDFVASMLEVFQSSQQGVVASSLILGTYLREERRLKPRLRLRLRARLRMKMSSG